jgi:hypothetical protein
VLELYLLRLREAEGAGDVGEGLVRKHDRAGPHRPHDAREVDVLDRLRVERKPAPVLLQEAQARAVNAEVEQRAQEPLVAEARRERELALRDVEGRLRLAQRAPAQARRLLVRGRAHRRVVTVNVQHERTVMSDK